MPGDSDDEQVELTAQQKRNRQRRTRQQTLFLNEQRRMVRQTCAQAQVKGKVLSHLNFEARSFVLFLVTFVLGVLFSVPGMAGLAIVEGTTDALIRKTLPMSVSAVEKTFHDTNTFSLLQSYLESILYPALYSSDNSGYLNQYNRVLGGVRLRQIRVNADESCAFDAGGFIGIRSYSSWGSLIFCRGSYGLDGVTEDTASFGTGVTYTWRSASENGNEVFGKDATLKSTRTDVSYPGSGYTVDLAIILEFSTYNPAVYLHQTVRLLWERSSAGELIMSDQIDLIRIYRYPTESATRVVSFILDAINTCYIIYFIFAECVLMFHPNINEVLYQEPDPDKKKPPGFQEEVFEPLPVWKRPFYYWLKLRDGWELLHLVNVAIFAVVLSSNIEWYLNSAVLDYTLTPTDTAFQNLAPQADYYTLMKQINAFNLLLSFFKLFKFMKLSATLNVLWLTLTKAGVFLFGYVAILFLVYFGLASLAYVVWGGVSPRFMKLDLALEMLLVALQKGFDYEELSERSPLCAPIFYFMYLFLVFFVMLNLFIAILSNSFKGIYPGLAFGSLFLKMNILVLERLKDKCLAVLARKEEDVPLLEEEEQEEEEKKEDLEPRTAEDEAAAAEAEAAVSALEVELSSLEAAVGEDQVRASDMIDH